MMTSLFLSILPANSSSLSQYGHPRSSVLQACFLGTSREASSASELKVPMFYDNNHSSLHPLIAVVLPGLFTHQHIGNSNIFRLPLG